MRNGHLLLALVLLQACVQGVGPDPIPVHFTRPFSHLDELALLRAIAGLNEERGYTAFAYVPEEPYKEPLEQPAYLVGGEDHMRETLLEMEQER